MKNYKTSSWYIDANGDASAPNTRFHEDRYEAERQYHLYCAAAATSEYPVHVAILETTDGVQLKRECYKHVVSVDTDSTGTEEDQTE